MSNSQADRLAEQAHQAFLKEFGAAADNAARNGSDGRYYGAVEEGWMAGWAALAKQQASTDAQGEHAYLCRAWGETDLPCVTIARSREDVRQFYIREWLGDAADPFLTEAMDEFDGHPWEDGELISYEFEIGGVSVERVFA